MLVIHHLMVLFGVDGDKEGLHMFCLSIWGEGLIGIGLSPFVKAFPPSFCGSLLLFGREEGACINGQGLCDLDHSGDRGDGSPFFNLFQIPL